MHFLLSEPRIGVRFTGDRHGHGAYLGAQPDGGTLRSGGQPMGTEDSSKEKAETDCEEPSR